VVLVAAGAGLAWVAVRRWLIHRAVARKWLLQSHSWNSRLPVLSWCPSGSPNLRGAGQSVWGCTVPNNEGLEQVARHLGTVIVVWLRSVPVVYINGEPFATRAVSSSSVRTVVELESQLLKEVERRWHASDECVLYCDGRSSRERPLVVGSLRSVESNIQRITCRGVNIQLFRLPCSEESDFVPSEETFDSFLAFHEAVGGCNVVVCCKDGSEATTFGMVCIYLMREISAPAKANVLRQPPLDQLRRGNWDCITELLKIEPVCVKGKRCIDSIIDQVGPPRGLLNLREIVFDVVQKAGTAPSEEAALLLEEKALMNLRRYFKLVCFAGFLVDSDKSSRRSFSSWMYARQAVRRLYDTISLQPSGSFGRGW